MKETVACVAIIFTSAFGMQLSGKNFHAKGKQETKETDIR